MNNKIAGSILLGFSGLVAAIGTAGTQIAYALVKASRPIGLLWVIKPPTWAGIHTIEHIFVWQMARG